MFKFYIDNFRNFKDQEFDLSRVNILIGENSGGKSSFIKFILALKQSIESPNVSNLILSGKYVDLGNYRESIINHQEDENLMFAFSFYEEIEAFFYMYFDEYFEEIASVKLKKTITEALKFPTSAGFTINKNLDKHYNIKTTFNNEYLGSLNFIFPKLDDDDLDPNDIMQISKCDILYKRKIDGKNYLLENLEYNKKGFLSIIVTPTLREACKKIKNPNLFYECAVFLLTQNVIEYHLDSIKYLNPITSKPKRFYLNKDSQNEYENLDLEKFTNLVSTKQITTSNFNKFNKILKGYGIVDAVKVVGSNNLPVSELRVKIKSLLSNISDVGYGVSLQIPILFEAFIAEQEGGSTFIIEQPEIHLHPKLQAKFIETLLSIGSQNNYIIETHSEHIVRMLQVIVKERKLINESNDANILYFKRGEEKFIITNHSLDKEGKMDKKFPDGFYDNSYELTKRLMF